MNSATTGGAAAEMLVPHNQTIYQNQELTIEEVKALFFDNNAVLSQPQPVYRLDSSQAKFYYTFDKREMRPAYFMAVTSFLSKLTPIPQPVIDKMVEMGRHAFNSYKHERALYGTMMDMEYNRFLIHGSYDLQALPDIVRQHHSQSGSQEPVENWIDELNSDITALAQWIHDYEVKPVAIGLLLVSKLLGIGGQLDLVCEMNAEKYTDKTPVSQRKRVRRLIDFKSGKKGFYESHILQCEAYKKIWDENFPEYPIAGIANFAPKAWLKAPTYDFKDHTDNPATRKLEHLIELARIDNLQPKRTLKMFSGVLKKGEPITNQYVVKDLDELIVEKMLSKI